MLHRKKSAPRLLCFHDYNNGKNEIIWFKTPQYTIRRDEIKFRKKKKFIYFPFNHDANFAFGFSNQNSIINKNPFLPPFFQYNFLAGNQLTTNNKKVSHQKKNKQLVKTQENKELSDDNKENDSDDTITNNDIGDNDDIKAKDNIKENNEFVDGFFFDLKDDMNEEEDFVDEYKLMEDFYDIQF